MSLLAARFAELFDRLRKAGLPLGMDEYLLLWRALRAGLGQPDEKALHRLCHRLWVSSLEEQALFDFHFDAVMRALPGEALTEALSAAADPAEDLAAHETEAPAADASQPESDGERETAEAEWRGPPSMEEAEQMTQHAADPVSAARMIHLLAGAEPEADYGRFLLQAEYMPLTRRQMKQSWRHLRRMVRDGAPVELDIEATVQRVARDGFVLEPALRPRRVNKSQLLLLLDQKGSMIPFQAFGRRLRDTALEAGRLGQACVYYFHNCPRRVRDTPTMSNDPYREHLVYRRPLVEPVPVSEALAGFDVSETDVLIFSDAGAARGGWNRERVEATGVFLYQLKALGVQEIAWLNPVPDNRWAQTSAGAIARFVPMFNMTHRGMQQAIEVLRGRSPRGVEFI